MPDPFALAEVGPILETAGEVVGRLIISAPKIDKVLKVLPMTEGLRRLLNEKKVQTEKQARIDGTKVLKVSKAIEIVRSEWTKLNEAGDLATILFPTPGSADRPGGPLPSPLERCIIRIRQAALEQERPLIPVRVIPGSANKVGRPKSGSTGDGGYAARRRGAAGSRG